MALNPDFDATTTTSRGGNGNETEDIARGSRNSPRRSGRRTGIGAGVEGPLRLVVMNGQTWAYSDAAGRGSVVAAELAVEDFSNTAAGAAIEIIGLENRLKAPIGAALARKAIEVDKVSAFFDIANTSVSLAVQGIAKLESGMAECAIALCFEQMVPGALKGAYDDRPSPMDCFAEVMAVHQGYLFDAPRAAQIIGGAGYLTEYGIERFYRDARLFRIYEGASQIQQVVIARNMVREAARRAVR
jgi:alkylation response protein AidB-like acyl-CoA dehydrogenase